MRLVSARWVIPIERPPLADGAIALEDDGTIRAVGPRAEVRAAFPGAPEEQAQGVLLPGLVNAHSHLELSALAGAVPGGQGVVLWTRRLMKCVVETSHEARQQAALEAASAAVRLGTAAIGDVGNSLDGVPAIAEAGLCGMLFHELVGSRETATGDALADAGREHTHLAHRWPPALGYVPSPHAPYSVGPQLMRRIFAAAAATGHATSVHVAEDPDEIALLRDCTGRWPDVLRAMGIDPTTRSPGRSPVAYLAELGAFRAPKPPLLVHMVHADAHDRQLARDAGATVVLCPRSNLHIGGQLADVPRLLEDGVALAVGTDSLASSPDLSLWGELAVLAAHFPSVPAAQWLEAATRNGARALGLTAHGALVPGKRPGVLDVLVEDMNAPLESLVRDASPSLRWVARP